MMTEMSLFLHDLEAFLFIEIFQYLRKGYVRQLSKLAVVRVGKHRKTNEKRYRTSRDLPNYIKL